MAGPGPLAHVLVSKFDDHVLLFRQNEIFARMGVDIPDTTLVDWSRRDKGLGKGVKQGRNWVYVRE